LGSASAALPRERRQAIRQSTRQNIERPRLILRHVESFSGKPIELDLMDGPTVISEIGKQFGGDVSDLPRRGAVIIDPRTDQPYKSHAFRRVWRMVADKAGIPTGVKNVDSWSKYQNRPLGDSKPATNDGNRPARPHPGEERLRNPGGGRSEKAVDAFQNDPIFRGSVLFFFASKSLI
jgi:hypothetical protein